MLRMSYMPSDFHPILLVLGTPDQLLLLAEAFDTFSRTGGEVDLQDAGIFSSDTRVMIQEIDLEPETSGGEKPGLWQSDSDKSRLVWRLPRRYAWIFANEVANLANSSEPAGSVTLECDVLGEIRAKISIGEWEEDYLTNDFR